MELTRFAIITVCYNAEDYISDTIDSLLKQKYTNYHYIIQDGMSTDNTMNRIIEKTADNPKVDVCSEKDDGIYDAMNRALSRVHGEYVFFLNAGDCLADDTVLARVNEYIGRSSADIVYGNIFQIQGNRKELRRFGNLCKSSLYFCVGSCICHQAIFAKKDLFERKKFDIRYRVCADREWLMFCQKEGVTMGRMGFVVASVLVEGFSSNHVKELEKEAEKCITKYYGKKVYIYKILLGIKKNALIAKGFGKLDRTFFVRRSR